MMDELFVVIRPHANCDFVFEDAFTTYEEADKCADDFNYDYEGIVYRIQLSKVKEKYIPKESENE
jgi:hypothetical protein